MGKMILWETTYTLVRDGAPGDKWIDYWHSVSGSGLRAAQERSWKLVYLGYTIADFTHAPYAGTDPKPQATLIELAAR